MKIADLQSFLCSLGPFLTSAGGSKVAADLEKIALALAPFEPLTTAEFADFLARADEYARTGVVPSKGGRSGRAKAPAKSSAELVKEASQLICSLYEKALDADFRYETVDQQLAGLSKLKADDLKSLAKEFDIFNVPRKKDDIIAAIARKIKGRREFHDRTRMEPTGPVSAGPALPLQ